MGFKKWLKGEDRPKLTIRAMFRLTEPKKVMVLRHLQKLAVHNSNTSHFEETFDSYILWVVFTLGEKESQQDVRNYQVHGKTGKLTSAGLAHGTKSTMAIAEVLKEYWDEGKIQNATIDTIYSTGPGNIYELPRQPKSADQEIVKITHREFPDKGDDPGPGGGGDGGRGPDYPTPPPVAPPGGIQKTRQQTQVALTAGVIHT